VTALPCRPGTMTQLRGELPSCVWRLTLDTGETVAYVTGDSPMDVLSHAAHVKKLRHRDTNLLRFQRLNVREVIRLRNRGVAFQ
jgi:hypothetical protein